MNARYRCVCFALPKKLMQHLADSAEGEHRELLQAQVHHCAKLRGSRHASAQPMAKSAAKAKPTAAAKPLQRSVFSAGGQTFLPGKLLRDEDDPPTRDALADQSYDSIWSAPRVVKTVFGRDSIDGRGMRVDTSVHYGFRFANAMWTGEQMIIGDGDGQNVRDLAGSLGIIAHEFAHGISQHLVKGGLGVVQVPGAPPTLKGEAGALNESFSDVMASMVKQWHAGQCVHSADWLLGEDILAPHVGKAIRSLKDPGNTKLTWKQDDQIKDYRRFKPTHDAHTASGIANHAFYQAATQLGGHSWETLGAVWYRGFDKLRARATFLDAAYATVGVAASLHGQGSATHKAVKAGWKQVNVLT